MDKDKDANLKYGKWSMASVQYVRPLIQELGNGQEAIGQEEEQLANQQASIEENTGKRVNKETGSVNNTSKKMRKKKGKTKRSL